MGDLKPTPMTLQMADRSVTLGILENMPVKVGKLFIHIDFVVLEMPEDDRTPIILGRPFLCTVGAVIDVGNGSLTFNVGGENVLDKSPKEPMVKQPCRGGDTVEFAVVEPIL
ncbi:hypothetical protein vseg_001904 [Gypsophila vaccaria]